MYRIAKGAADALIRWISQTLPAWQHYTTEQSFPAREPYRPTPPINQAMISVEMAERFAALVHFRPYHIYRLRNTHVTWDGAVFHNLRLFEPSVVQAHFVSRFQDTLLLRQWVGEQVNLPTPTIAVCHDQWSAENYYHWLVDTLPRLLMLRQTHPHILLMLPQPLPPRQLPDYVSCSAAVLGFLQYLPITTRQVLHAGCVILPELTAPSLTQNPELIKQVRTELISALHPEPAPATRRIYAARAIGGVRTIVNEAEVDVLLQEFDFEKIYFEQLTFVQQISLMRHTAVFLGVHGAGMTNMLFLQDEAVVIELLNEVYGDLCYYRLASCLDLTYFCAPSSGINQHVANQSDIIVNVGLLRSILYTIDS